MKIIESVYHSELTERKIPEENAIVVKGLRKVFKELTVLDGVDFAVKRGTVLALLGPNGAGKTTTINILSTLLLPDSGQAIINGFDVVINPFFACHLLDISYNGSTCQEH